MIHSLAIGLRIMVAVAVCFATFVPTEVRAELPPGSYEKLRAEAQEAITGKVLSVETKELEPGRTEVVAEIKVTGVERSKVGLKKGDVVTVKYVHIDPAKLPGFAGPRPIPILKNGKIYPAFLNKVEGEASYEPAAYGASFTEKP